MGRMVGLMLVLVALAGCSDDDALAAEEREHASKGAIRGVVVDQAVMPVADAQVVVVGQGVTLNTTSDDKGEFVFAFLEPGAYTVTVSKQYYLGLQGVALVQAGVQEPEMLRFQIQPEVGALPFTQQFMMDGFIECSAGIGNWCFIVNVYPCVVMTLAGQPCFSITNDRSFLFLQEEFLDLQRSPDWLQMEAVWESTQSLSTRLAIRYAATAQDEFERFSYGPVLANPHGESPLVGAANATAMADAEFGTNRGLTVELFHGAPDAAPGALEDV